MPVEAKLFTSSAGSVVRGYLKFRANIPPRWIRNARGSRKRSEPEIVESFRSFQRLRIGDHEQELRLGMRGANCARSGIGGKQPTAKRTFIGEYESCWRCSGKAPPVC